MEASCFNKGGTWYPKACRFEVETSYPHSPWQKSTIGQTIQYIKDRTESFDDYYLPCNRIKNCKLEHVKNWLNLFADYHNKKLGGVK